MYDNYININKKFKASVNLSFDIQNEEKIEQYIPTSNLCDVIKKYIKSILVDTNFKSTTLSGPYGKGKSYLLLMILYLISRRENRKLFEKVCSKIRLIDQELYDLLIELDTKGYYLLPVIINNNTYDDLNKNFIAALNNSLKHNGFDDIIPNTSYAEALSIVEKWEGKTEEEKAEIRSKCIQNLGINLDDLKNGLRKYNSDSFKQFTDLYTCVSYGLEFFSMKSDDIVTIYSDVNNKLVKKDPNCKGLFVVYDEFGTFLNNQTNDFVTRLGKIQSFAEKCNESENNKQMHFCCITHKDILLYKKDKAYNDAFDTIAGRFETVRFDRSLDENYQIICSALNKKSGYKEFASNYVIEHKCLYENIFKSGIFDEKQLDYIMDNGFPFNPITLYILVRVSEKIAQNERTLFTFLSDDDIYGFKYFISNTEHGTANVDIIYDYFEDLIKNNDEYKMLYYKVEALKKYSTKKEDHNIFKAIALIKILNDSLRFNTTIDNIAIALGLDSSECKILINNLIEKKILKTNMNDGSIDFAIIADKKINKLIAETAELKFADIDLGKYLTANNKNKYEVSNEYNFNTKMVRYYRTIYLEASKLVQFNSLNSIVDSENNTEFSDGLLINLINDIGVKRDDIKAILNNSTENIIIKYLSSNLDKNLINKVKELSAVKLLLGDKKNLSESAEKTLPLLVEDMTDEINTYLLDTYSKATPLCRVDYNDKKLSSLINKSFLDTYSSTVILNNEQVNKNEVSSVTAKARNTIIDAILKQINSEEFGSTSQEATIYRSFDVSQKDEVLNVIKNLIRSSNGEKRKLSEIISILKCAPFGMRNGIIPLYLAKAISDLSIITSESVETIILFNNNIEIEFNGNNLSKACLNPEHYNYCYTQVTSEKIDMVKSLSKVMNVTSSNNLSDDIRLLNQSIKKYVANLAPIIVKTTIRENLLKLSIDAIAFKDLFLKVNSNNFILLFEELPKILKKSYCDLAQTVLFIKNEYEKKIEHFYKEYISKVKSIFEIGDGSLRSGFEEWINRYKYIENIIFENDQKNIFNAIKSIGFDDKSAIDSISFSAVNCSLVDFNIKKANDFIKVLDVFREKVINYSADTTNGKNAYSDIEFENIKLSSLGNTLYNNLLDVVEEYGASVSNEEKALIYKKILNELLR